MLFDEIFLKISIFFEPFFYDKKSESLLTDLWVVALFVQNPRVNDRHLKELAKYGLPPFFGSVRKSIVRRILIMVIDRICIFVIVGETLGNRSEPVLFLRNQLCRVRIGH